MSEVRVVATHRVPFEVQVHEKLVLPRLSQIDR